MRISDWSSDACSSDLPNARSVQALLDGDENGFRLADPLADGERLRAIFRTIDDVSAQDGRMTLSIEAIGDNTTERTTLVTLEKVEGAMLDVNLSERQAPVYWVVRSDEHSSEHQSLMRISYAVFCLQKNKSTQPLQTQKHITHTSIRALTTSSLHASLAPS